MKTLMSIIAVLFVAISVSAQSTTANSYWNTLTKTSSKIDMVKLIAHENSAKLGKPSKESGLTGLYIKNATEDSTQILVYIGKKDTILIDGQFATFEQMYEQIVNKGKEATKIAADKKAAKEAEKLAKKQAKEAERLAKKQAKEAEKLAKKQTKETALNN